MAPAKRTISELAVSQEDDDTLHPAKRRPPADPLKLSLPTRDGRPPLQPPQFQQPFQLLSFSYTSQAQSSENFTANTRTLEWKDASLRYYVPPPAKADLSYGYARWVRRPEERPRLDGLLAACMRRECSDARAAANVVAWRGVVTKILTAPYEERDGWTLNVMRVGGTLYLEEHLTSDQLRQKTELDEKHRLMTYYGYAFESYCTTDAPGKSRESNGWGGDVDTNVQWCSVVKTKLGSFRLLLGGEVDCVRDRYTGQPDTFVELKTSLAIRQGNRHDAAKFEKKLLKFHMQSFLLGVPEIIVGFRTPAGRLQSVQTFRTLDIPRLVRGTRDAWDPAVCLSWGARVFEFLLQNTGIETKDRIAEGGEDNVVWRVTFTPRNGITLHVLDESTLEDVRGGEERVGFLPQWYMDEARAQGGGHTDYFGSGNGRGELHKHGQDEKGDNTSSGGPATHVMGWTL